jgi:erythronate-4-phosphate dehydrogenase
MKRRREAGDYLFNLIFCKRECFFHDGQKHDFAGEKSQKNSRASSLSGDSVFKGNAVLLNALPHYPHGYHKYLIFLTKNSYFQAIMKIIADKNIPFAKEAFSGFGEVVLVPGREIRPETLADCSILLVRSVLPVTAQLLQGSPVQFVATATIGVEHIDREYLAGKNIGFSAAPGSNADSVAEYVVASILLMAEKIGRPPETLVLGIIGVGNIGTRMKARAEALGMRYILNDPPRQRATGREEYRSLDEVLENSDIVTVHVPLEKGGSDPTYHLVNDSFLEHMKPGAVLISASRGKTMDDASLKKYGKKLGGLVLDVWNNEPDIDPEICDFADISTPHIAGYSYDGKINGTAMIYRAACEFFNRPATWDPAICFSKDVTTIDCSGSADPVYDAVIKTVPILRDSAALKKFSALPEVERGKYFDMLRATYPKRLEFRHFSVACDKARSKEIAVLKKLGFGVMNT